MNKLHSNQEKILKLLTDHLYNPLSISDLCALTGISSKGVVHHHIVQLERKGFLKRNPQNPRDYTILGTPEKVITYVEKYGMAQCGPGGILLDGDPIEKIPIPSSLLRFHAVDAFIVEARGKSMEPKILPGDLVIAKKQSDAEHGDIIVCTFNLEVLIKKYILNKQDRYLYSLSVRQDEFPPIRIDNQDEFYIAGVVKNIFQYH